MENSSSLKEGEPYHQTFPLKIQLSEIKDNLKINSIALEFMRYFGTLTYRINENGLKFYSIPNQIAQKEYIQHIWEKGMEDIKNSIEMFERELDLNQFCKIYEEKI